MFALNNVSTADDYEDATTLECPGTTELDITVGNAAVYIQFGFRKQGYSGQAVTWAPLEGVFFPPGFFVRGRNVDQVRVKSAVAGKPAQVTIEAVT